MGNGFSEAPLAVFTTLAPMSACAVAVVMVAVLRLGNDGAALRRLDRAFALPLAVCAVGFVGAMFHLANPLAALNAIAGLGRSPLTNEIAVGGGFLALAAVYWLLALAGKLSLRARRVLLAVLSVWAVAFAAFCGVAYMMPTIPTWDSPWSIAQMVGYGLLGGAALGGLTVRLARVEGVAADAAARFALAQSVLGGVASVAGFGGYLLRCAAVANMWGLAIELVPLAWPMFAILVACAALAVGLCAIGGRREGIALFAIAFAVCVVAVFLSRIVFYGTYMSVAL